MTETVLGEAFENAGVAVSVFADDGRYIACNTAFCRLSGYTRDEILQMRVGEGLAAGDGRNAEIFRAIVHGSHGGGQTTLKRKDGEVVPVAYRAVETHVSRLPFFIVLYWPLGSESS